MTPIDLLRIQQQTGFYGKCFICGELIHPERLVRGANTCSPEHQSEKRKSQKKFLKELALQRVLSQPKARRLAIEKQAAVNASGTATGVSEVTI